LSKKLNQTQTNM